MEEEEVFPLTVTLFPGRKFTPDFPSAVYWGGGREEEEEDTLDSVGREGGQPCGRFFPCPCLLAPFLHIYLYYITL